MRFFLLMHDPELNHAEVAGNISPGEAVQMITVVMAQVAARQAVQQEVEMSSLVARIKNVGDGKEE